MKFKKVNDKEFVIRLEKGEKIIETLYKFCESNNIKCGHLHGLGAVSYVELAHFDPDTKDYNINEKREPLEIVNLTGNISEKEGFPYLHCHAIVATQDLVTFGGHLREAIVSATCEVILKDMGGVIKRKKEMDIGLDLLDL